LSLLYTLGYAAAGANERLGALMADGSAVLVDVRLSPASRFHPTYRRQVLEQRFGARYHHVPQLGNVNYRDHSLPMILADAESGLPLVVSWLEREGAVCLLCACSRVTSCHRLVVARLVSARCSCEVLHL
jgi:uncharacterized protein (DUF488 family)